MEKYQQINQKNEGSDSNLSDSSFGHSFNSWRCYILCFYWPASHWTTASEAVSECKDTFGLAPGKLNQKMTSNQGSTWKILEYEGRCISFTHWFHPKKVGKSSNHAKLPFSEIYEIAIRISRFDFRAVAPDSKWVFIFLQSRLLILSHSKWRGMESSWELPIFSLYKTQSMLGAQSFSIVSCPSKTIRCSFVSSLFSQIVLCSPGLHLNTSALLGKHLLHVCPVPGKSWKTDTELPGGILLVGLAKDFIRPSLIDPYPWSIKKTGDIAYPG